MLYSLLAAMQSCADVAVPPASEKALEYFHSGNILWGIQLLLSLAIPFLFLFTGVSGKLSKYSHKIGKNWFFTIAVYLVLFSIIYSAIELPLDFYMGYIREHQYGFSNQTIGRWLSQYMKSFGITLIGMIAFIWIFYLLIAKSPKRWWFYSALVSIGISLFLNFIQPIWVDPHFHHYNEMSDKKLEKQILDLAHRAGIENSRVYEVDMSKDTNAMNAYVIGFGSSKRIVLWDTLLKEMNSSNVLFVMGHEMGHYVLHHILWNLLYTAALAFITFYLIYRLSELILKRYKERFGFHSMVNIASLPLLLLLMNGLSTISDPLSLYISRTMEHQADTFGLEITQNSVAAAEAFVILQTKNLGVPYPGSFYTFFRASHPSLGERITYCNEYCPWRRNQPLEYGKYFKK